MAALISLLNLLLLSVVAAQVLARDYEHNSLGVNSGNGNYVEHVNDRSVEDDEPDEAIFTEENDDSSQYEEKTSGRMLRSKEDEEGGDDEEEEEENEEPEVIPDVPLDKCVRPASEVVNDFKNYIAWKKTTKSRKQVVVLDRLLTTAQCKQLLSILQHKSVWLFFGIDEDERVKSKFAPKNHAPWTTVLKTEALSGSGLWQMIKSAAEDLFPLEEDEYVLTGALGYVIRWGDHLTVDGGDDSSAEGLTVQIFLDHWKRNLYGETLVLNTNTSVAAGIHPKYGRVAIFPTSVLRLMHPPAIHYRGNQHIIELTVHRASAVDKISEQQGKEQRHLLETGRRELIAQSDFFNKHFPITDANEKEKRSEVPDLKAFVKREYVSDEGKRFMVLDNTIDMADVDTLRQFVLHHTSYQYDTSTDSSDNVKWITGLEVVPFVQSRFATAFQRVVNFFTGVNTYYPYDVSCNLIRAADHTLTHKDCQDGETDVTILVYLNPNWTENLYGETVFLRGNWISGGGETITAVRPRYGRVVIFDGTFLHSARPPSPTFGAARYSFAVKYASTKQAASKKDENHLSAITEMDEDSLIKKTVSVNDQVLHLLRFLHQDIESVPPGDSRLDLLKEDMHMLKERVQRGEEISQKEVDGIIERAEELQNHESYGDL